MDVKSNPSVEFDPVIPQITVICEKIHAPHPLGVFYGENPLDYSFSLVLLEIILIILISRLIRILLKPLKQPRIVSDIIGGMFIGPSVLGCNKKFTASVLPDNAQFLLRNVGVMGFMFFLFLAGVKMDLGLIKKSGKKHLWTALVGVFFPFLSVGVVGAICRSSMEKELARASGIGAVATNLAFTSFPVIHLILKELNLLSSEIGRMALSTAVVGDCLGILSIIGFEALKQAEFSFQSALFYLASVVVLVAFYVIPIRRAMFWIVRNTPEGRPVNQNLVIFILLAVLVMGFFTDMFGIAIANGSMWLGLIIPDGPPLGATIVERSETIVMEILMPFSFAVVGLCTDVFSMADYGWTKLAPLFAMTLTGYFAKLLSTLVAALYFEIPLKDSLTLSLVMNLRGQLDLLIFIHWMDKRIIGIPMFTMLVLLTIAITAACTPLISMLYNPTKPYMVNKRRTIQHNPPGKELRIVVCIDDEENVSSLIDLLEMSYPTANNPFSISALHLIELIGRATPILIDHEQMERKPLNNLDGETIQNALRLYQEARDEFVKIHFYTAITVKRTMYQDICELAMLNKASLIILPFGKGKLDTLAGTEIVRHGHGMQSISSKVIAHAPCSVGIFVDKSSGRNPSIMGSNRHTLQKYVMLFLGGADAREALTYADRMVMNPDVSLIVVRFLSYNSEGDDEIEKKLDDGVVTWFWVKNESNERVFYREVVVKNGEETLAAIQAFKNSSNNDLWIVGRKQGINPVILQGLSNWSENRELGLIGDFVASIDFDSSASVLVVHQQIMRGQGRASREA
ncbi:hypothetical protein JCGZ_17357 [Jatropha curcas]|uniref:Uncharacterized protein n=1 Tax=Jatropha curcas TaxID=180498 RepID=A0A067LLW3_JATCU|nr:hypothetical protein JCGZ_17357 [Jatropha curcas]